MKKMGKGSFTPNTQLPRPVQKGKLQNKETQHVKKS